MLVHADLEGAPPTFVRNHHPTVPISPLALFQAGTATICRSKAWDSKIVTSAWWVQIEQVSTATPPGGNAAAGTFSVIGRKQFLPPAQLIMGFAVFFRLSDDSLERHKDERKIVASTSAAADASGEEVPGHAPGAFTDTPADRSALGTPAAESPETATAELPDRAAPQGGAAEGPVAGSPRVTVLEVPADIGKQAKQSVGPPVEGSALGEPQAESFGGHQGHDRQQGEPAKKSNETDRHRTFSGGSCEIASGSEPREQGLDRHSADEQHGCSAEHLNVEKDSIEQMGTADEEVAGPGSTSDVQQVHEQFERFALLSFCSAAKHQKRGFEHCVDCTPSHCCYTFHVPELTESVLHSTHLPLRIATCH